MLDLLEFLFDLYDLTVNWKTTHLSISMIAFVVRDVLLLHLVAEIDLQTTSCLRGGVKERDHTLGSAHLLVKSPKRIGKYIY